MMKGIFSNLADEALSFWHLHRSSILIVSCLFLIFVKLGRVSKSLNQGHKIEDPQLGKLKEDYEELPESIQQATDSAGITVVQDSTRPKAAIFSKPIPKRIQGSRANRKKYKDKDETQVPSETSFQVQPVVFFFSLTGSTKEYAERLLQSIKLVHEREDSLILEPLLLDLADIEFDEYFITPPKQLTLQNSVPFYLILTPTYNIDTHLDIFLSHLQETHNDFRIDKAPLSSIAGYSVFGIGDRLEWPTEKEGFCSQAIAIDKWLAKLTGRKRAYPLGTGDVKYDVVARLDEWTSGVQDVMKFVAINRGLGEGLRGSGDAAESDEDEEVNGDDQAETLGDLEDIGALGQRNNEKGNPTLVKPLPVDFTTYSKAAPLEQPLKEMVPITSPTYAALTKQGYTIIGSHSGVKICRWTKSALRGRGSCYKHSFYGIASHLCMETTPSLSCSNKCVFCWRHGTNPVGTTWRWQVDPPEMIFEGAVAGHLQKIKMMRGIPGVRAERFQEAQRIRHCALSLVGEPIFYPHINEFVALLHKNRISSFLVCNAQHPDQLAALKTVTQLYVSIDASNRDELRRVDRPLHRDFWERFLRCLDILRTRRQEMRTVYRLTLVKGFNLDEEAEGYADLVARGLPCFVEIKGVTYCGASGGLTMQNVPFWHEVVKFVELLNAALTRRGLEYGIAAEHAHSCCALLASTKFKKGDKWHTLIDYERYFELLDSGESFGPEDYMGAETPAWALWGQGGFDPSDVRVDRKGKPIEAS